MEGHLERLRNADFASIQRWLTPGARILELGGGSGYQANLMAARGFDVVSIDLQDRPKSQEAFFPVQDYDGRHIPFENASFDIVFSSNVLEHVRELPELLAETRRVLKPGGIAIHLLPSASWRFWTFLAHYIFVGKSVIGLQKPVPGMVSVTSPAQAIGKRGLAATLKKAIFQGPHGEYPNAFTELYYFSRFRWSRVFARNGFRIRVNSRNAIFYTGYALAPQLSLPTRQKLARLLGSSCHVFVMAPA